MKRIEKVVGIVLLLVSPALLWGATLSVPTDSHPTIQSALEAASDGDVVEIQPGVYEEVVDFLGKAITVTSIDPKDPEIVASTIVWGVLFENNEQRTSVLEGLTIAYPNSRDFLAIYCYGSSPVIQNNVITGYGVAIDCWSRPDDNDPLDPNKRQGCSPLIRGNIISHNQGGIASGFYASPLIINNTFYGNTYGGVATSYWGKATVTNCIFWDEDGCKEISGLVEVSHCCIRGAWLDGDDVIFAWDPLFADPENGDFHLKSKAGRWLSRANSGKGGWVKDNVQSPCIDAGSPEADFANEPSPNGGRINLGAYGNTPFASKSFRVPTQIKRVYYEDRYVKFEWWARKDESYRLTYSIDLVNWRKPWFDSGEPWTPEKDKPAIVWCLDSKEDPYLQRRFYRLQIEPQ